MRPDVICRAESLPFADGAFDVVACRTAAHHFADPAAAVREMTRVSRDRVLLVDTVFMGDDVEEAETPPRPVARAELHRSGVARFRRGRRSRDRRGSLLGAHLRLRRVARAHGLRGRGGRLVEALLADRVVAGRLTLDKIAIRAVKGC